MEDKKNLNENHHNHINSSKKHVRESCSFISSVLFQKIRMHFASELTDTHSHL